MEPDNYNDDDKFSLTYARKLDSQDPLRHLREDFIIPTQGDIRPDNSKHDSHNGQSTTGHHSSNDNEPATYLCGNSLGLQPRCTKDYIAAQLDQWAKKAVTGHFTPSAISKTTGTSTIPPWVDMDDAPKEQMAALVGASPPEVAIMETLTANLHLLMAAFYRPDITRDANGKLKGRYKIILEEKAFPSDHYAVESQVRHHDLSPSEAVVLIKPPKDIAPLFSTEHILATIDEHASSTALLLLPGIQFYTGQYLDIKKITAHAQSKGIIAGWDLAHAAGNMPMQLHDWNVDFAAWCTYKYLNCGPGAVGALFVHERHCAEQNQPNGSADTRSKDSKNGTLGRQLTGWWGSTKQTRFAMTNTFEPIPGASQFQLSNPSALDLSSVLASLSVFSKTSISALRTKSLQLTGYLEDLLLNYPEDATKDQKPFKIITPSNTDERGAQLSILLEPGLLDTVMEVLMQNGVIVDERKPDVVRVAPAPIYNNAEDCWRFASVFLGACEIAQQRKTDAATNGA